MDPSLSLHITVWIWIIVGVAGVIGAAALIFGEAGRGADKWWQIAFLLGMGAGGSGLLTLAVAAAGWPSVALYIWRATAIVVTLLGMALFVQRGLKVTLPDPVDSKVAIQWSERRWSTAIGTLLLAGLTWLSFRSNRPQISSDALSSAAPVAVTSVLPVASMWLAALVVLGLGTIYFLHLFVQRLEEGGAPQIEAHWGGIGGGLGGWRMSPALGHVLVATLLAVLFTIFLFRLDSQGRSAAGSGPSPTPTPQNSEVSKAPQIESKAEDGKGPH
jgi:hypothetical protein